jgi:protein-S-isoprenylcysteine O-methyltransferase Ste14
MKDRAGAITVPPLIYAIFLIAGIWWGRRLPLSLGPEDVRRALGGGLVIAGLALAIWAMIAMVRAGTTFNPWVASRAVVTTGPFRFTRNPIYLADAVIYCGVAVLFDSLLALALLPVAIAVIQAGVIAREESYLERKFGEEYLAFKRRVRRWL